jgi:hypothetical protein
MNKYVKATQEYLIAKGYSPGKVDGDWGDKTEAAYNDFLKVSNLEHVKNAKALGLPADKTVELVAYYGSLDSIPGQLVQVLFPWKAFFSGQLVKGISVHKKAADSLKAALNELWELSGKSQEMVDSWGLSVYDGSYNRRPVRNGSSPSVHAFGAAIDFNAEYNPNKIRDGETDRDDAIMPEIVLDVFQKHGWKSGGRFWKRDYMHIQRTQ